MLKRCREGRRAISILFIMLFVSSVTSFKSFKHYSKILKLTTQNENQVIYLSSKSNEPQIEKMGEPESAYLTKALNDARQCESKGLSPGAGLSTADEQSDAAYADLINTSIDQRGLDISDDDIKDLEKGGTMWEKTSRKTPKLGLFGAAGELFKALSGGAHIEKNKYGET